LSLSTIFKTVIASSITCNVGNEILPHLIKPSNKYLGNKIILENPPKIYYQIIVLSMFILFNHKIMHSINGNMNRQMIEDVLESDNIIDIYEEEEEKDGEIQEIDINFHTHLPLIRHFCHFAPIDIESMDWQLNQFYDVYQQVSHLLLEQPNVDIINAFYDEHGVEYAAVIEAIGWQATKMVELNIDDIEEWNEVYDMFAVDQDCLVRKCGITMYNYCENLNYHQLTRLTLWVTDDIKEMIPQCDNFEINHNATCYLRSLGPVSFTSNMWCESCQIRRAFVACWKHGINHKYCDHFLQKSGLDYFDPLGIFIEWCMGHDWLRRLLQPPCLSEEETVTPLNNIHLLTIRSTDRSPQYLQHVRELQRTHGRRSYSSRQQILENIIDEDNMSAQAQQQAQHNQRMHSSNGNIKNNYSYYIKRLCCYGCCLFWFIFIIELSNLILMELSPSCIFGNTTATGEISYDCWYYSDYTIQHQVSHTALRHDHLVMEKRSLQPQTNATIFEDDLHYYCYVDGINRCGKTLRMYEVSYRKPTPMTQEILGWNHYFGNDSICMIFSNSINDTMTIYYSYYCHWVRSHTQDRTLVLTIKTQSDSVITAVLAGELMYNFYHNAKINATSSYVPQIVHYERDNTNYTDEEPLELDEIELEVEPDVNYLEAENNKKFEYNKYLEEEKKWKLLHCTNRYENCVQSYQQGECVNYFSDLEFLLFYSIIEKCQRMLIDCESDKQKLFYSKMQSDYSRQSILVEANDIFINDFPTHTTSLTFALMITFYVFIYYNSPFLLFIYLLNWLISVFFYSILMLSLTVFGVKLLLWLLRFYIPHVVPNVGLPHQPWVPLNNEIDNDINIFNIVYDNFEPGDCFIIFHKLTYVDPGGNFTAVSRHNGFNIGDISCDYNTNLTFNCVKHGENWDVYQYSNRELRTEYIMRQISRLDVINFNFTQYYRILCEMLLRPGQVYAYENHTRVQFPLIEAGIKEIPIDEGVTILMDFDYNMTTILSLKQFHPCHQQICTYYAPQAVESRIMAAMNGMARKDDTSINLVHRIASKHHYMAEALEYQKKTEMYNDVIHLRKHTILPLTNPISAIFGIGTTFTNSDAIEKVVVKPRTCFHTNVFRQSKAHSYIRSDIDFCTQVPQSWYIYSSCCHEHIVYPKTCVCNAIRAIRNRQICEISRIDGNAAKTFINALPALYKKLFPINAFEKIQNQKWLNEMVNAKNRLYTKALEKEENLKGCLNEDDMEVKAFVKLEPSNKKGDKPLEAAILPDDSFEIDPRLISGRNNEYNTQGGMIIKTISKIIAKLWNFENPDGIPQITYFSTGQNKVSIGRWLDRQLLKNHPVFYNTDYSRFDASTSEFLLRAETEVYKAIYPDDTEFHQWCYLQHNTHGSVYVQQENSKNKCKVSYGCRGTRKSGEQNTSLGNTIVNVLVQIYAMSLQINDFWKQFNQGKIDILVLGDDTAICLDGINLNEIRYVKDIRRLGLVIRLEKQTQYTLQFCSSRFVPAIVNGVQTHVLTQKFGRNLSRAYTSTEYYKSDKAASWIRQVSQMYRQDFSMVPFMFHWHDQKYQKYRSYNANVVVKHDTKDYPAHLGMMVSPDPARLEMYMQEVYSINKAEMRSLLNNLSKMKPNWTDPIVMKIISKDVYEIEGAHYKPYEMTAAEVSALFKGKPTTVEMLAEDKFLFVRTNIDSQNIQPAQMKPLSIIVKPLVDAKEEEPVKAKSKPLMEVKEEEPDKVRNRSLVDVEVRKTNINNKFDGLSMPLPLSIISTYNYNWKFLNNFGVKTVKLGKQIESKHPQIEFEQDLAVSTVQQWAGEIVSLYGFDSTYSDLNLGKIERIEETVEIKDFINKRTSNHIPLLYNPLNVVDIAEIILCMNIFDVIFFLQIKTEGAAGFYKEIKWTGNKNLVKIQIADEPEYTSRYFKLCKDQEWKIDRFKAHLTLLQSLEYHDLWVLEKHL